MLHGPDPADGLDRTRGELAKTYGDAFSCGIVRMFLGQDEMKGEECAIMCCIFA